MEWSDMVAACAVLQVLGNVDFSSSAEAAALFGLRGEDVVGLGVGKQLVRVRGRVFEASNLDYLIDPRGTGVFD